MRPLRSAWWWVAAAVVGVALGAGVAVAAGRDGGGTAMGRPDDAAPVDFSTPLTIISALNTGGYICLDPTRQADPATTRFRCEHDGDVVAVAVGDSPEAAAGALAAARQSGTADDLIVSGDRWSIYAPSSADAHLIRGALGL